MRLETYVLAIAILWCGLEIARTVRQLMRPKKDERDENERRLSGDL